MQNIKVIAFDLDGTLTQHKTPICALHRQILTVLSQKYKLLMLGAGQAKRVFHQLGEFPVDVIGSYGMQYGVYNPEKGDLDIVRDEVAPCDREKTETIIRELRQKFGYTSYAGDPVEYHPSGCVTFPLLGTKARQEDKLSFDPDRAKRRKIYADVVNAFDGYCVFIGGSSSFDMAPKPYNKYFALDRFCRENGYDHDQILYIGDDYGTGGNDESVYLSDFPYRTIDSFMDFPVVVKDLTEGVKVDYWRQGPTNIYVAAHRGLSAKFPENTMEAFQAAIDAGVDQIESDVRVTRDGELVMIHDATVDRTTNGSGKVEDLTLEELRKLDAGGGARIPTFLEFMELIKRYPVLTADIELKEYPLEGREKLAYEVCDKVLKIIDDYDFADRVVVNTFSGKLHEYITAKYGKKYRQHVYYPPDKMQSASVDPYSYGYCTCVFGLLQGEVGETEAIQLREQTGVRLWAGAYVKDEETVDLAARIGAELITCNNADEVLAILKKKHLHR